MDVQFPSMSWRHRRWTIGGMMLLVAAFAVLFSLIRPGKAPATIRVAADIVGTYAPEIDLRQYDAKVLGMTADRHYWRVQFLQTSTQASAPKTFTAVVPDWRVRQLKRKWWWQR